MNKPTNLAIALASALAAGCASQKSIDYKTMAYEPAPLVSAEEGRGKPDDALAEAIRAVEQAPGIKPTFGYNAIKMGENDAGEHETRVFTEVGADIRSGDDVYNITAKSNSFTSNRDPSHRLDGLGETSKTTIRMGSYDWQTKPMVAIHDSGDHVRGEVGIWDTRLQDALGLYGRTELSVEPDGDTAHGLLFVGKRFDALPLGKTLVELTYGATRTGHDISTFQELEVRQDLGKTGVFIYGRLGAADHRFNEMTRTVGIGLDLGDMVDAIRGK